MENIMVEDIKRNIEESVELGRIIYDASKDEEEVKDGIEVTIVSLVDDECLIGALKAVINEERTTLFFVAGTKVIEPNKNKDIDLQEMIAFFALLLESFTESYLGTFEDGNLEWIWLGE